MIRTGLFRWCVTLLTAVCVPLCCCTFEALAGGCGSCEKPAAPSCHASREPDHCHSHAKSPAKSPGKSPVRQCKCGGELKSSTSPVKPEVKFQPPALVCVLADLDLTHIHRADWFPPRPVSRAPLVPAMTLLRQHCALIV